jgi:exodeoxyribonuclease VII small subunit
MPLLTLNFSLFTLNFRVEATMAKKAKDDPQGQPSFEQRLSRLEQIVEKLESGEVGLDESLKLYAEGAGHIRDCRKTLAEAEKKISRLTEAASGDLATEPFEPPEDKAFDTKE